MEGHLHFGINKKFPHEIKEVEATLNKELLADYTGERDAFLQVGQKRWLLPNGYRKHAETLYNFQARPDDVWIVTYPRTVLFLLIIGEILGTTMTQKIIWLLANNLDFEKAVAVRRNERFPFLEHSFILHPKFKEELLAKNRDSAEKVALLEHMTQPAWIKLEKTQEKRFIKTHLPFDLLTPNLLEIGCKVVYVARNPKDVAVSYYHFYRTNRLLGYSKDFPKFWNYFEKGLQLWGPFWSHIKEGWERRNDKNILFLFYEDITRDMNASLRKISEFLGKTYSDEELLDLENYMRIDNFKKRSSTESNRLEQIGIFKADEEGFVRKGLTGGWKDYFPPDLNRQADAWIEENFKNTDLRFPNY